MSLDSSQPENPVSGSVAELLSHAAAEHPDVVALKTPDQSITYRELFEAADDRAARVRAAGADRGSVVATLLPNGVEWLVSYWGATVNGNVVVPLSTRATPAEVERLISHAGASVLISEQELRCLEPADSVVPPARGERVADATHLIQFTSGSTGEPKGAMLTHRGLISAARQHAEDWKLMPGDVVFVPNPFSHILGLMYGVLTPTVAQATVLTMPRFDLAEAVELLVKSDAVALTGAPTHLQMLTEWVERQGLQLPRLRLGFTGGAPIASEWVDRVRRVLGLEALINGYGMSEVGSIAQTAIDDSPEQVARSVGFLAPGLEARIVDPETGNDLPSREVGELWLRGPSVMLGYLGNTALTEEVLVEGGWLRTGDMMQRDSDGRLSFVTRLGDMFTVGGFNVYPAQVERTLTRHPEIDSAVVVPVADQRLGSVPVAFVVRSGGRPGRARLDEESILAHCKADLRNYMVPRYVFLLETLPLNRAGKVDRPKLAQQAEETYVD